MKISNYCFLLNYIEILDLNLIMLNITQSRDRCYRNDGKNGTKINESLKSHTLKQ